MKLDTTMIALLSIIGIVAITFIVLYFTKKCSITQCRKTPGAVCPKSLVCVPPKDNCDSNKNTCIKQGSPHNCPKQKTCPTSSPCPSPGSYDPSKYDTVFINNKHSTISTMLNINNKILIHIPLIGGTIFKKINDDKKYLEDFYNKNSYEIYNVYSNTVSRNYLINNIQCMLAKIFIHPIDLSLYKIMKKSKIPGEKDKIKHDFVILSILFMLFFILSEMYIKTGISYFTFWLNHMPLSIAGTKDFYDHVQEPIKNIIKLTTGDTCLNPISGVPKLSCTTSLIMNIGKFIELINQPKVYVDVNKIQNFKDNIDKYKPQKCKYTSKEEPLENAAISLMETFAIDLVHI